jgi:hypothetical protein
MVVPLYISENAPRAIRGGLTGIYQLFIATGTMLSFWVNYGSILHLHGHTSYIVPLAMQALPAVLLIVCIFLNNESPRFLAKQDRWEEATKALCRVRHLPPSHPYIQAELGEISEQLEHERLLVGGSSTKDLLREMFTIPGNRKRALISIGLMVCQQMTGTNAINYYAPQIFSNLGITGNTNKLFATGIYGVVKMVTCAAFLIFGADSLGRRRCSGRASHRASLCFILVSTCASVRRYLVFPCRLRGILLLCVSFCSPASSSGAGALCVGSMSPRSRLQG